MVFSVHLFFPTSSSSDLITLIMCGKEYKSFSSSLCSLLLRHPHLVHIFLSSIFYICKGAVKAVKCVLMSCWFFGTFAKLQQETISSSCLPVCLSAWNSVPTGWIFMELEIRVFFKNLSRKFRFH